VNERTNNGNSDGDDASVTPTSKNQIPRSIFAGPMKMTENNTFEEKKRGGGFTPFQLLGAKSGRR